MAERRRADQLLSEHARQALLVEGLHAELSVSGQDDVDGALARVIQRLTGDPEAVPIEAGVSHEVRNAMTGVLGFTQVALRKLDTEPQLARQLLVQSEQEVLRCVDMLTRFLSRARQSTSPVRQRLDLRTIVRDAGALVELQLHAAGLGLDVDFDPAVPAVCGDASALKQVVLNLVLNAIHATAGASGRVRISVTREQEDAVLRVADSGPGVMPVDAERIFEPFFTTKPPGEGTGLGLAVSREIVESHGGTLVLEESDLGAVFRVRLPAWID